MDQKEEQFGTLDERMRSVFNQLTEKAEMPDNLKQEVFDSLNSLQLMADFTDLFTAKFTQSELSFLDILTSSEKQNNK